MSQAKFDNLAAIYRAMDFGANSRRGKLTIADNVQRESVTKMLSDDNDEYGLKILQGNADTDRKSVV